MFPSLVLLFLLSPLFLAQDLADFDLQKRRLNAYVTANAVHAKPANRSITISGGAKIPYTEAFPPFLIRNRGTVVILAKDPSLLLVGRPSLFQMITASGHRTVLPKDSLHDIDAFLSAIEAHHTILILFPGTSPSFPSSLEGAVLLDPPEDSDLPPATIPTVLLYTSNRTADDVIGWSNTRIESTPYSIPDLSSSSKAAREKLAQILANFFDKIQPR